MSRKTDHVHITELAGEHRLSRRPVAGVEPPLKADLDERARLLYMLDDRMGGCQVEGDGLLAEGRHACVGGHVEELGMDGRRRRDDERVYAFTGQAFDACRLLGAQRFGDPRCPLGVRIDHGEPRYERALLQGLRVQRADASDAHHPDVHFPLLGAQRSASSRRDRATLPTRMQPLHPQARAVLDAMAATGGGEGAHPSVMFVHGGGWVLGSVELSDNLCRALCRAAGMLIASVEYRLAPEHPFPAGLDDAYSVLGRLHTNPGEIDAIPGLLAVCGDSAGGNLAAAVALRARDSAGPDLALQCLIYPALDPTLGEDSYERLATGYGLTNEEMRHFWSLYLARAEDAANPYASPLRATDLGGVAPALIVTAGYDPLLDEGERYGERLRAAGVRARTISYPGMIHGFVSYLGWIDAAHSAVEECAAALKDAMATQFASR